MLTPTRLAITPAVAKSLRDNTYAGLLIKAGGDSILVSSYRVMEVKLVLFDESYSLVVLLATALIGDS